METEPNLEQLRSQISQTTKEIIRLASRRNELARRAGQLKAMGSLPVEDFAVEDALEREVIAECDQLGVSREFGLKVLSVLLKESKKSQGIGPTSLPSPIFTRALALQRTGKTLLRLDVGEPDFRPPKTVVEACADALFEHRTRYTESGGIPELRAALRSYLARKKGFEASDEQVTITPSGRFAVFAALGGSLREGESAVIFEPNWPAYRDILAHLGVRVISIPTTLEDRWEPDLDRLRNSIGPTTRAIVLSYPSNPTGKVISPTLFRQIVRLADDLNLTVLSDEIYNEYSFVPCPSILDSPPKNFILTSSFSKTWSMTGFRVGYAVSSPENITGISRMTSLILTSVPEFIQWGAIKALDADSEAENNAKEMKLRIEAADSELARIDRLEYAKPDGGMYFFPKLKNYRGGGNEFCERLLGLGVSLVPGSAFGPSPDFFRISLGQPLETILKGIGIMRTALG